MEDNLDSKTINEYLEQIKKIENKKKRKEEFMQLEWYRKILHIVSYGICYGFLFLLLYGFIVGIFNHDSDYDPSCPNTGVSIYDAC